MGMAVLEETNVLLGGNDVPDDAEDFEDTLKQLAYNLRLEGHQVVLTHENDGELDFSKYLSEDTIKYLDSIELNDSWKK